MARQAQNQAQQTYKQSQNFGNASLNQANALYGALMPQYMQETVAPQGMGAKTIAALDTASQQSTGGSTAGAVGQGALRAARTRNTAGIAPAIDTAARGAAKQNAENTLQTRLENEALKESQRQGGLAGMGGLYGTTNADVLSSLGLQNQSTNALTQAGQSGWFQNMTGLIAALNPRASGTAGGMTFGVGG